MKAGPLRHRITIESKSEELDSDGISVGFWTDAFGAMLSAEITPLSGGELIAAQAQQSKATTRIKVRYRPGIVPAMRAVHRTTIYNIEAVIQDPNSGQRWVTLLCSSGLNEG